MGLHGFAVSILLDVDGLLPRAVGQDMGAPGFAHTPSHSGVTHQLQNGFCSLARLSAGKFGTNYLMCQLAALAMNLLRIIGQHTRNERDPPVRHTAKRRRGRTVMHQLMCKAARVSRHYGQTKTA